MKKKKEPKKDKQFDKGGGIERFCRVQDEAKRPKLFLDTYFKPVILTPGRKIKKMEALSTWRELT